MPVTDHPFLDSFSLDIEGKQARYAELLRELPAGLSEWAVHPGLGTAESRAVDPDGWRVRRSDYAFLTSPEARELVRQEGIAVIDYRALQQTWSRIGTPR
ncbi:ChbG/HpnK family deacetylase [Streptomyces scopuliridis]|uniref:ChbG/HpnK family deacetylase n=1 Tax=Streptomyces scopuliridis TaxID=452529 RepID=UPI0036AD57D8